MRLYVWRSPSGWWLVTTTQKEQWLAGLGQSVSWRRTHAEAITEAQRLALDWD